MNERTRRTGGACNNNQYIQDLSKPPIVKLPGHSPAKRRNSGDHGQSRVVSGRFSTRDVANPYIVPPQIVLRA
jgi:hypothetical protein